MTTGSRFRIVAFSAALVVFAGSAHAGSVDPAGNSYAQPGTLKAKIQHVGKLVGEAPLSTIEYGPNDVLAAGEFLVTVEDASGALFIGGEFNFDGKKVALNVDPTTFASALEDLIELEGELPADSVSVSCETRAKAKVKEKQGIEVAVTRAKVRCLASVVGLPDTIKVVLAFKGKGEAL